MSCLNSSLDIRKRNVLTRYISHRKNMFGFQQFFVLFLFVYYRCIMNDALVVRMKWGCKYRS